MNSGWKSLDLSPLFADTFLNSKRAAVSRHLNIAPGFDNRTPIGIDSLPRFRGVFTRRYLKLCRGTVELFGFIFGRASLHALSVA